MKVVQIHDIEDLRNLEESLSVIKNYCFRGQANSAWDLIPTIYRPPVSAARPIKTLDDLWFASFERNIYREFQRRAVAHVETRNSWESLCVSQHFGVPTRLLDWTRNLYIASYFALIKPESKADKVAVWCLNLTDFPFPKELGRQVPRGGYRLDNIRRYAMEPTFFQDVTEPRDGRGRRDYENGFIVFEVPTVVRRIENQDSLFAVYLSSDDSDLVWNHSDYIVRIEQSSGLELLVKAEILKSGADKLQRQLERVGINPYRLFPDLTGLGMLLRDEHNRDFQSKLEEYDFLSDIE